MRHQRHAIRIRDGIQPLMLSACAGDVTVAFKRFLSVYLQRVPWLCPDRRDPSEWRRPSQTQPY
eukprot:6438513-Prymnesium_polylepis.1